MKQKTILVLLATFALLFGSCKTDSDADKSPSAQEKINAAVDAVTLDAPAKASMTASELTGDKITASGFDSSVYRIEYLNISGDEANRTAAVTFRLSNGTLQSKSRTISINGFKEKPQAPSAQEKINAAVDAVTLDAPAKASMTAHELTGDKITASGFDSSVYRIEYLNISGDEANRTAAVTFRLSKGTLQSKSRTITINGFKEKPQAPSAQEKINAAVDAVTLDAPAKASMTASELTGDKIMASGFDANVYRIEFLNIAEDEANRTASVTFRLSKGTLQSKSRTISINGFKEKPQAPSAQEKINAAVDAVTLDAPAKASMTARELTGDKITASGFDAKAYRIEYLNISGDEANRTAAVTFRLSKGTLQSKSRTISINGFKEKPQAPSAQEKINAAVDAVTLDAPAKASMTASELTGDKITASGFDANVYRIEYLNIAGDEANRTAAVTFRLSKGTLQSKSRTISINGFKEKPPAPSAQEKINAAVDAVTLDAPAKASMTASELTGDKITASGFDANAYRIEYLNIAGDEANRTASVTFRLSKGTLQSKSRTISINGFKEKTQAPSAPEYTLSAAELLSVCGVQQGRESAAAAAKKIAAAAGKTLSDITFTSAAAVRYDDERGTFTVKVKGAKDGKNFDTEITQSGFTHPYASPLQSVQECVFDLNPAIEENLSLDAYISKAETDVSAYLKFSMQLENGKRVTLGKRDGYRFAAQIGKDGNELKAVPQYFLSYKKLQTGGAETEEEKAYMHGAARAQKKPYFTENDVFSYVLGKTNANFITVDSTIFASSVYAIGKAAGAADVFDMEQIQKYIDRYQTKTDGTHLGLKLTVGLYNAKNGTIRADDSAGELTLQYCITTEDALAEHITGGAIRGTAISESITKSGFKRADAAALKGLFVFKILKNGDSNDEAAKKWKRYMTGNGFNHDYRLVTSTDDNYTVNSFPSVNSQPFYFTINDESEPANVFAKAGRSGLSEGNSREEILITRLILEKKPGEQKLCARFTLVEGTTISVDYSPAF